MKKTIFALFGACLFIISCKKDDPGPGTTNPGDQPYYNYNTGTNWIYERKTQDPAVLDTITTQDTSHVIDGDTTVGAKSYHRIQHNDGSRSYYNVTGNDYYQFQDFVIPSIIDTSVEALYLKDNGTTGTSWNQQLSIDIGIGIPINVTLTSTISGTGLTRTVKGITYSDVIGVGTTVTAPGLTINSTITNYYARNIGLIEGNYDIDVAGLGGIHNQTQLVFSDPH